MPNKPIKPKRHNGLALLCLDAGGATAISQLIILRDIMHRWKMKTRSHRTRDIAPCEVFDAICGIGMTGFIAILLVVFGMTAEQALEALLEFSQEALINRPKGKGFALRALKRAATNLIEKHGMKPGARLLDTNTRSKGCKLIVPLTHKENTSVLPRLRNYRSKEPPLDLTILEAILATCADPEFYDAVFIQRDGVIQKYLSGAATLSNPIRQLIAEAHDHFGPDSKVASLISLGAGLRSIISVPSESSSRTDFLAKTVADSEKIAQAMQAQIGHLPLYLRLNVRQGLQNVSSDAWDQVEHITTQTRTYLEDAAVEETLEAGTDSLVVHTATATLEQLCRSGGNAVPEPITPSITSHYVDRPGPMAELVTRMSDGTNGQKVTVISGMGGCGTTTLVLKYIKNRRPQYVSVFFIDGGLRDTGKISGGIDDTHARIRASLTQHVRSLGTEHSQKTFDDAMAYLRRPIDGERLIVFDNIDDPELDLDPYLPDCPSVSVIVTTRDPDRGQLASGKPIEFDTMSEEEAVQLLFLTSRKERTQGNEEGARSMAAALGYHPIALVQAGRYIQQSKVGWEDYLRTFEENRQKMMDERARNQRGMRYASAYAAFDASYSALSSQAQQLLHLLSQFHRLNFPVELIGKGAKTVFGFIQYSYKDSDETFTGGMKALQNIFFLENKWSEHHMNSLFTTLQNYSFISITDAPSTRLVHIHSLIHTWARDRINQGERERYSEAAVRLLACGSAFKNGAVNQYLAPHVLHMRSMWSRINLDDKHSFSDILSTASHYKPAYELAQALLHGVKEQYSTDLEKVATAMDQVCYCLFKLRRHSEAITLCQEILEIQKQIYGANHVETIKVMSNLAVAYSGMGQLAVAAESMKEVLRLRNKLMGSEDPRSIFAAQELARIYHSMGRYKDALKLDEEVLQLRRRILGDDHLDTIEASSHLAITYHSIGRYDDALKLQEGVLRLRRGILGDDHLDSITASSDLAGTYHDMGRYKDAIKLDEEVLRLRRGILGNDHPDTIQASSNLAATYHSIGQYEDALTLEEEVLRLRRRILGGDNLHTIQASFDLAVTYWSLGRRLEAFTMQQEVWSKRREIIGDEHPDTLYSKELVEWLEEQLQGNIERF